jgi:hypothetical protein
MTTEQAYIEGFVKRASEYGFSYNEAISLLKQATLVGDQSKLDVNHNGKIEATDLKALRNRKKTSEIAKQAMNLTPMANKNKPPVKKPTPIVPEMDTQPGGKSVIGRPYTPAQMEAANF